MTKLTDVERLMLANQFRILSKLEPGEADRHAHAAEALMSGYEGLYQRLIFEHLSEPLPARVTSEVQDIVGSPGTELEFAL